MAVLIAALIVFSVASALVWAYVLRRRLEVRGEASIAAAITSGILYMLLAYTVEGAVGGLWPVVFIAAMLIAGIIAFAVISVVRRASSQRTGIDA